METSYGISNIPGKEVAYDYGLLWLLYGLYDFGLLGVPNRPSQTAT